MAHLLKARTVEPEKQSLLVNGSETTFVSKQQILNKNKYTAAAREQFYKHVPAV
jgi:predicted house-cleaning NTP pyrophosphatase (Maf/HAM1 superfamily)